MRFTAAVVLASAAVASASIQSTAYETELVTITACPPTVPDCPAKDQTTSISTSYYPVPTVSTVDYPVPTVTEGVPELPSSSVVVPPSSVYQNSTISATVPGTLPVVPTGGVPVCPSSSVVAVTKSYTTVLTSVEYSTVEVPCPTTVPAVPTLPPTPPSPPTPPAPGNSTIVTPPPVNGAGSMTGSALFAAAAGLVAVYLA